MFLGRPLVVRFVDEKVRPVFFSRSRLLLALGPLLWPVLTHTSHLSPPQVLYSNDRLSDDSAVVEAEKARKQENERDKEHKRIRCRLSSPRTWLRNRKLLTPCSHHQQQRGQDQGHPGQAGADEEGDTTSLIRCRRQAALVVQRPQPEPPRQALLMAL